MHLSFPLTTMEEFLYWEDRPAYPWSCFVRMEFSGRLDRAAFEKTVRVLLERHPMLASKVANGGGRLHWSAVENPAPIIRWETAPVGDRLPPASHLDLRSEIGIRFHVRVQEDASDLTIQFHHACCDGAGMILFLKELLIAYAMAVGPVSARTQLPPRDPRKLSGRGRFGLTLRKLIRMAPQQAVGILGARQFLMRRPIPVLPHKAAANDGPLPDCYPATLHHTFDAEATAAMRHAAASRQVTLNDLLARDLFLALGEWRARQNVNGDGEWLRMMVPVNLRTVDDRLLPATNVVSSVFLDRRGSDFADADRLLQGIHDEMDLIKRLQLGLTFIFSTAICRWLPGGVKKQVRADKCTISCIFTNLGNVLARIPLPHHEQCIVAGNVTLVDMDFVAPLRPYSCVTMAAGLYAHQLILTLHYDPRPLSERQASDLLGIFVQRLRSSITGAAPPVSRPHHSEWPSAA
jgi:NRPS condensation-like uncharacterized protein